MTNCAFFIDLPHDLSNASTQVVVETITNKLQRGFAILGKEVSTETKKHHLQVYCSDLSDNEYMNIKYALTKLYKDNYKLKIGGKNSKGDRATIRHLGKLTKKVTTPDQYCAYCMKDNNYVVWTANNMARKELLSRLSGLPKYKASKKHETRTKWKQILDLVQKCVNDNMQKGLPSCYKIDEKIVELYWEKFETLPTKATILKIRYKLELISTRSYLDLIGL